MNYSDLFCLAHVMDTHADLSVYADICIGYDRKFNLIVLYSEDNWDVPKMKRKRFIKMDKREALRLAKRMGVHMTDLPTYLANFMEEYYLLPFPEVSDARRCFHEIAERLIDEGTHFTVV